MSEAGSIEPSTFAERVRAGEKLTVLDVRDRDEFEAWHVDGPRVEAQQVPHVQFLQAQVTDGTAALAADLDLQEPVVVVCGRGEASAQVADQLAAVGLDAVNLAGGMDAWARVYDRVELDVDVDARVFQYRRPASGCLASLVVSGGEAAVVDPLRAFADRYVADADALGATLVAAADTHVHADHVSGVREVADATGARRVVPAGAADRGLDFEARLIADGERLEVGDVALRAVHAPGHTSEMTAYRLGGLLLSGDLVFGSGVARPDLEAGAEGAADLARRLHETLARLVGDAPADRRFAPGHHGPRERPAGDGSFTATAGELRERLPALSLDREAFVDRFASDLPPRPANYERILEANLGRDALEEGEAFELELGPNNCAVEG